MAPHIPTWASCVGNLIAEGAEVRVYCSTCGGAWTADLKRIAAAKGCDYELHLHRTRCREPGCQGRVFFRASRPGAGVPSLMLTRVF